MIFGIAIGKTGYGYPYNLCRVGILRVFEHYVSFSNHGLPTIVYKQTY
jgi:hypothetical protein